MPATIPLPVTVDDLEAHLNATTGSLPPAEADRTLGAATLAVEGRIGPIVTREFVDRIRARNGYLALPRFPVVAVSSVVEAQYGTTYDVSLLDVDPAGIITWPGFWLPPCRYDVTYTAGRGDVGAVGENLELAVLITAAHLWETQRGASARGRTLTDFENASTAQDVNMMIRGFALPRRALELLQPADDLGVA